MSKLEQDSVFAVSAGDVTVFADDKEENGPHAPYLDHDYSIPIDIMQIQDTVAEEVTIVTSVQESTEPVTVNGVHDSNEKHDTSPCQSNGISIVESSDVNIVVSSEQENDISDNNAVCQNIEMNDDANTVLVNNSSVIPNQSHSDNMNQITTETCSINENTSNADAVLAATNEPMACDVQGSTVNTIIEDQDNTVASTPDPDTDSACQIQETNTESACKDVSFTVDVTADQIHASKTSYRELPAVLNDSDCESMSSDSESDSSTSDEESAPDTDDSDDETQISTKKLKKVAPNNLVLPPWQEKEKELIEAELPKLKRLHISVPSSEASLVGKILSIVDTFVLVESEDNLTPLKEGSILFMNKGDETLGAVFEVMGPVNKPVYSVLFNSKEEIKKIGISVGNLIYYAPHTEHSLFIDVHDLMRERGSDASWKDNQEPPVEVIEHSDDEAEREHKRIARKKYLKKTDEVVVINETESPPKVRRITDDQNEVQIITNSSSRHQRNNMRNNYKNYKTNSGPGYRPRGYSPAQNSNRNNHRFQHHTNFHSPHNNPFMPTPSSIPNVPHFFPQRPSHAPPPFTAVGCPPNRHSYPHHSSSPSPLFPNLLPSYPPPPSSNAPRPSSSRSPFVDMTRPPPAAASICPPTWNVPNNSHPPHINHFPPSFGMPFQSHQPAPHFNLNTPPPSGATHTFSSSLNPLMLNNNVRSQVPNFSRPPPCPPAPPGHDNPYF